MTTSKNVSRTASTASAKSAPKPAAPKAAKPKVQLLPISPEAMKAAAVKVAAAEVTLQRAHVALLAAFTAAVAGLKVKSMSAVQYDRQFRPAFEAELAAKVKRRQLKESSAKVAASRAKTVVLALANGFKPHAGETVGEFRERASVWLASAKLPGGASVWEQASKRGPKLGSGRKGGAAGGPTGPTGSPGDTSKRDAGETGLDLRPRLAAAMILTGNKPEMAQRLCIVMESYAKEFEAWTSTILTDKDKAELGDKATTAAKLATLGKVTTAKAA